MTIATTVTDAAEATGGFPVGDWQFWVVTAVFLAGLWLIVRLFLPRRGGAGCPTCTTGTAANRKRSVALTIDRKPAR